jgi:hypothetical protein
MKELRNILIFSNKLDKLGFNTHADLLDKLSEYRISSSKFKKNAQQSENISNMQDECCDKLREVFTLLNIENKEEFLSCLDDITHCVNDPSKLQALMRSCDSIVEKFFDEEHYEQTFEDDKYKFEEEYHDEHMHEKPMPKVSSKKKL